MQPQYIEWNGKEVLAAQVQPIAGHPELGMRPKCSELKRYDDASGASFMALTKNGAVKLTTYPDGIDQGTATAYLNADGLCEVAGTEIGVIPLSSDIPAEIRQAGYEANQVPKEARLPVVVAQAPSGGVNSASVAGAPPAAGGGPSPILVIVGVLLLVGGGVGALMQRKKSGLDQKPAENAGATEGSGQQAAAPQAETPKATKQATAPMTDFEKSHKELQDLLGDL
ncbi:MAG TPA: hypothetical protein V6D29_01375 [Leptolyngbyaceae cyanobacterium]